jgi:hypothetical protein
MSDRRALPGNINYFYNKIMFVVSRIREDRVNVVRHTSLHDPLGMQNHRMLRSKDYQSTGAVGCPSPERQAIRQPVEPRRDIPLECLARHDVIVERHGEATQHPPRAARRHGRPPGEHERCLVAR